MRKFTLLLISTLPVMAGAIISAAVPQMVAIFAPFSDDPRLLAKLMITLPALFVAVFAPLMGYLSDRWGRLPVLSAGLLLFVLAGTSGLYLSHPFALLGGRALLGLSVSAIMTTSVALVGDLFEGAERQTFMGQQGAFMALGGLVFVTLGGWLADHHWRFPFAIYLIALVFLVLAKINFPRADRPTGGRETPESSAGPVPINTLAGLYGLAFYCMLAFYLVPVQVPFSLQERFQASGLVIGLGIGVSTAFSALTGLLYGKLKSRLSFKRIHGLGLLVMALGYFLFHEAPTLPTALMALAPAGLGAGIMLPNLNTWLVRIAPAGLRGRLLGGLTFFVFMGMFLSPVAASFTPEGQGVFAMASLTLTAVGFLLLGQSFFFSRAT